MWQLDESRVGVRETCRTGLLLFGICLISFGVTPHSQLICPADCCLCKGSATVCAGVIVEWKLTFCSSQISISPYQTSTSRVYVPWLVRNTLV